jgi:hypothetical protein
MGLLGGLGNDGVDFMSVISALIKEAADNCLASSIF